jgi:hypothetical protein
VWCSGRSSRSRAHRDVVPDEASLQVTGTYAKGKGFEFPFEVPGVLAQEVISGPAWGGRKIV